MIEHLVYNFVTLFVVLDPIGLLAVFLAVSTTLTPRERRTAAMLAVCAAFAVLVFFIAAGELLLIQMGIPLRAFQIAGGILLLLYGIEMSLGAHAPGAGLGDTAGSSVGALAVYPLAIPAIAGPGAMLTVVLLTDNRSFSISEQLTTAAVLAVVLTLFLLILLAANPIMRVIGMGGANVLRRVMGVLLSAIAVKMVLTAVQAWLDLPPL
ncbi:MAG: MarC family protein [Thiohalocapsa sp.]